MKFRAALSEHGRHLLEKQFLPCLEKHGKVCEMLLSPEEVHLIQSVSEADGMHITARWAVDVLFAPDTWKVQSRHNNLVAFKFEVAHLKGALRAASNSNAEFVEIKLTMKSTARGGAPPPTGGSQTQPQAKPFLCLTSKGQNTDMTHEIPIGRPFSAEEIDELVQQKDVSHLCPYYLDIQGEQLRLQALVDKLKSIDLSMTLVTTRNGFMYLQVAAPGVQLAAEVQNLEIVPADARSEADPFVHSSPEGRLTAALQREDAHVVVVQIKQFARSLHSSQVAAPGKLLIGIAENRGHVHFMFVFGDPFSDGGYDDNISLSYKMPIRDDD